MKPPVCELCDARLEPGEGALVRCVPTASDVVWRQRAEREGLVGHPPDAGWFCGEHAEGARELAGRLHLGQVFSALREREADPAAESTEAESEEPDRLAPRHADIGALYSDLRAALPALAEHAGLDPAALTETTRRDWHPMDGTVPPDCPFADTTVHGASAGGVGLELRLEVAHWSADDAARSYLSCALTGAGERDFRVGAWSPASGDPHGLEAVTVRGALPDALARVVG